MKTFIVWFTTEDFDLDYEIVRGYDEEDVRSRWVNTCPIDEIREVPDDKSYLSWV